MNPYYSAISERANHRCEYCHAPELVFNFPFEVEHIVPIFRQGTNEESNLALACRSCNLRKGTRVSGSVSGASGEVSFFHPRQNYWDEHFGVESETGVIVGITAVGKVTVENLQMNSAAQVAARKLWIRFGLFP